MFEMFDKKGSLIASGYSKNMIYNYERKQVKCKENRFKEWDFFQFNYNEYIFQVIIAHALIFDNYYVGVFNIKTNERNMISLLKLHNKKSLKLINNPDIDFNNHYILKNFSLKIENKDGNININYNGFDDKKEKFDACVSFKSENNKMTILHPFKESNKMFYLNQKENYFNVKLIVKSKDFNINTENANGVLDWGRGYWPFNNEWYWGNHSFIDNLGNKIGWNLGYGFGTCKDTENILYINNKEIKLNKIISSMDKYNPMEKYVIDDENNIIHLEMEPIYDNYSKTKILWINKWCHQVYNKTTGYINYNNEKIMIDTISFFEFEENHW